MSEALNARARPSMDWKRRLTPHFILGECIRHEDERKRWCALPNSKRSMYLTYLIGVCERAEALRASVGKPLRVTSGWRSREHNAEVGGAPTSQHLYGRALDLAVVAPHETTHFWALLRAAESLWDAGRIGGLGIYLMPSLHIETRLRPARWGHDYHASSYAATREWLAQRYG